MQTTDDMTAVLGGDKIVHILTSMQIPQTDGNATKTYEIS